MIYIFGDSWGFSYKQVAPQTPLRDAQVFDGKDLACLMSVMSNVQVYNLARRGMDLNSIVSRITKVKEIFTPEDTIIVLQTDPFRSYFVNWWNGDKVLYPDLGIDSPMTLEDVCEQKILEVFYRKLVVLQKMLNVKIILHGGLSKLDHKRATDMGLTCTEYTSTEVVAKYLGKEFQDSYFLAGDYTVANHEYLEKHYEQYIKGQDISEIVKSTDAKNQFWADNPEYFTFNHTTEKGSKIVAEYLCNFLKTNGAFETVKNVVNLEWNTD